MVSQPRQLSRVLFFPLSFSRSVLDLWIGDRERARGSSSEWGLLGPLALVAATGLLTITISFSRARLDAAWSETLFWTGLALMFFPVFGRLLSASPSRRERIGLTIVLGIAFYVVKLMHSPVMFTHHDEFLHWRTTSDILHTGELFHSNPMLPVSALYPALEAVTVALMQLTGFEFFLAGALVIGASRIVLILALFLIFESILRAVDTSEHKVRSEESAQPAAVEETGSGQYSRVAGVATALYLVHPNFLFFNGMYKYESLALAFAGLALFVMVRRQSVMHDHRLGFTVIAFVVIAALTVTHHLTAYAFIGLLLLWFVVSRFRRAFPVNFPTPTGPLVFAVLASVVWLVLVADIVVGYIAPHLTAAITEVISIITREGESRELFGSSGSSTGGTTVPMWERYTALSGVMLLLLAIPFGLLMIWRRYRASAIALTLGIGVLAYPAGLALRFTGSGWEIGNRTSEFVFLAVGFVVATGIVLLLLSPSAPAWRTIAIALCSVVILFGGIISGWPPAWRLPGPYEAAHAGTRSIEEQGIGAADWANSTLGPGNRLAADSTNHLLMGSIGLQDVQTSLSGGLDAKWVLFAPELDEGLIDHLAENKVRYIVVDERWANEGATSSQYPDTPISVAFAKFDEHDGIDRIFDSGDVIVYDLHAVVPGVSPEAADDRAVDDEVKS